MTAGEQVYSEADVRKRLNRDLHHWYLDNGWLARKYETGGWKATLMVINTVGHLAEAAWHHPDIEASYGFVVIKLKTHSAQGITDKDLELARRIEVVIQWRPDAAGALEGTPDDPRYTYIKYD